MKYLGIDPGRTIGYAVVHVEKEDDGFKITKLEVGQERQEDWKTYDSYPLTLVSEVDLMAIEDFVGAGIRSNESNHVLKMIGAFELIAKMNSIKVLVQAPAKRRKYLKVAEKLYKKHFGRNPPGHGQDALAHALKAIAVEQGIHPEVLL